VLFPGLITPEEHLRFLLPIIAHVWVRMTISDALHILNDIRLSFLLQILVVVLLGDLVIVGVQEQPASSTFARSTMGGSVSVYVKRPWRVLVVRSN